jgi:antitoxin component of RelBE/YafQ-DinJ toxin-antitoxin module
MDMEERLTIRIPIPLKEKARKKAKEQDLSMSDYIRTLLIQDL